MKHKLLLIWVLLIFGIAFAAAISQLTYAPQSLYNAFLMSDVVVFFLGCPILFVDSRLASKSSMNKGAIKYKNKVEKKNLELRKKTLELEEKAIELERRDLEIERKNIEIQRKGIVIVEKEAEIESLRKQKSEITEDDIRVSRERHFCLVHKGDIKGYSYICPNCSAFYCLNCVEAIKEIENECWACGHILDPSLSSKRVEGTDVSTTNDAKKAKKDPKEGKLKIDKNPFQKFCGKCGKKINMDALVCIFCGSHVI